MSDSAKQDCFEETKNYVLTEYIKTVNVESYKNNSLQKYMTNINFLRWSHVNRLKANIQALKTLFASNKIHMTTTCFKVTFNSTSCIYGYLHSQYSTGTMPEHMFVCIGPTYKSQDGEYRHRFIRYEQFSRLFDRYAEIFEMVEAMILDKMTDGDMSFQTDFYHPTGCVYDKRSMEDSINNQRLPIKLLMLCWLCDFYWIHNKIVENHINPAYQFIIYQPDDIHIFESIVEKLGDSAYMRLIGNISDNLDVDAPTKTLSSLQCGQKIIPLGVAEVSKINDINFAAWREIHISGEVSNLVINLISPSFPIINNWFYIQNAHAGLFDNFAMHEKYVHSDIAGEIVNQLRGIDKQNYIDQSIQQGPISNKFRKLSYGIHEDILYADRDIKLTDLAVCITSEYVGRTLRDIPMIIVQKTAFPGMSEAFTDNKLFQKHIFEYIYAFFCMNTKLGIIHGDLHVNNATIWRLYAMSLPDGTVYIDNAYVVYMLGEDAYLFPHAGLFSIIIDFSRALLGDVELVENEHGKRYADIYFKDQQSRILNVIFHYFPKLIENYRSDIESLLVKKFPLMFKILTAIDTFVLMSNIYAMFNVDEVFVSGQLKVAPIANSFLTKLVEQAESLIFNNIQAAIDGRISDPKDIEFPNLIILRENFSDFIFTTEQFNDPDVKIVEIFNSNNTPKWKLDEYDTWGPIVSPNKELEIRRKYKQPIDPSLSKWIQRKQMDETEGLELIAEKYKRLEDDNIQYEPWMFQ